MSNIPLPYRALKAHVRFITEGLYYKESIVEGIENIPSDGTSTLIASNHQNCMNDAMEVILAINDRKPCCIVRGDVFALSQGVNKFLRSLGLLPAFRLGYEGAEAMKKNADTFKMSEQALADGETVLIFPEGGHARGHWLNVFKSGMAKMAFEAAELNNFEKEIFIVPTCNHYSSYKGIRLKSLVRFGEKVPVSPLYELYKTKPRTAIRTLSEIIRSKIESMVLDEKDKEFYYEMEYIRGGKTGREFAIAGGYDPDNFSQRFESDKMLIAKFLKARTDENPYFRVVKTDEGMSVEECAAKQIAEQSEVKAREGLLIDAPGEAEQALLGVRGLLAELKKEKLQDSQFDRHPSKCNAVLKAVLLLALLPAAIFSLWPSVLSWFLPKYFSDRMKKKSPMFEGTFLIALNVLIVSPLAGILSFILVGLNTTFLLALLYILTFPALCLFEWHYCQGVKSLAGDCRWFKAERSGETKKLEELRESVLEQVKAVSGK